MLTMDPFIVRALEWVACETRFRAIACLGEWAWEAVMLAGKTSWLSESWANCRDRGMWVDVELAGRSVRAFPMYHTAYPRGYDMLGRNWPAMATFLRGE